MCCTVVFMTNNNIPKGNNSTVPNLSAYYECYQQVQIDLSGIYYIDRLPQNVLLRNNYSGGDLNVGIPSPLSRPSHLFKNILLGSYN